MTPYLKSKENRAKCLKRGDDGVCAVCGLPGEKLDRVLLYAKRHQRHFLHGDKKETRARKLINEVRVILAGKSGSSTWEVHHINPREYEGRDDIENLETLCPWDHARKTALQAGEKAKVKRQKENRPRANPAVKAARAKTNIPNVKMPGVNVPVLNYLDRRLE